MNWPEFKRQWHEAQLAVMNLPTDDPVEAALIDQAMTNLSEIYNHREKNAPDAPRYEGMRK